MSTQYPIYFQVKPHYYNFRRFFFSKRKGQHLRGSDGMTLELNCQASPAWVVVQTKLTVLVGKPGKLRWGSWAPPEPFLCETVGYAKFGKTFQHTVGPVDPTLPTGKPAGLPARSSIHSSEPHRSLEPSAPQL